MARVRLIGPETATEDQRAAFAVVASSRGTVGNLFRAMAHTPELTRRVAEVGSYLRFESPLPDRLREAVILTISGRWQCRYESSIHAPLARSLGLSQETVEALLTGEETPELTALEQAAVRYARALAIDGRPAPPIGDTLSQLGEAGLVELHVLAGYYSLLAFVLNGLDVDLDSTPQGAS